MDSGTLADLRYAAIMADADLAEIRRRKAEIEMQERIAMQRANRAWSALADAERATHSAPPA